MVVPVRTGGDLSGAGRDGDLEQATMQELGQAVVAVKIFAGVINRQR